MATKRNTISPMVRISPVHVRCHVVYSIALSPLSVREDLLFSAHYCSEWTPAIVGYMKELLQRLPRNSDLCGNQDEGYGPILGVPISDSSKGYAGRSPSESNEKTICRHWVYMQRLVSYMFEVGSV